MPVDVFPDLDKPTVTLQAEAGGMAPEEVEQLITFPLETAMGGLPGVEGIRSVSSAGLSFVYVAFGWDTDVYRARQLVAERLAVVREQMPPGVTHVGMGPVSSIMGEIMLLALPYGDDRAGAPGAPAGSTAAARASASIGPMAVREVADFVIRPRLLTIPGVAQVVPIGGEVRQYQVQPDTVRMAAAGVALEDLSRALQGFSANTSGGFLERNGREYLIRHIGRTTRLEDLQRLPVAWKTADGAPRAVQLSQVAEVAFAPAIRRGDAGFDGGPAVVLGIQKQPGADTVALTRRIEAALAELRPGLPAGMGAPVVTMRQASFIEASVGTLRGKLLTAAVVVAVVLYFFLRDLRTTLIALAAIPLSILATVLVFRHFGLSINTMTLGGLTIALGELVDDAVVGVENIVRRMKQQRRDEGRRATAAETLALVARATLEVRSGIVYATAITVLVLLPLFFLPGIEGRLMQPLAVAYIVSLLASMVVSVTVTPVLACWLLPGLKNLDHGDTPLQARLLARYAALLGGVLRRPAPWVAAAGAAVLAAAAAVPFFPTTFLPPFNEGTALVGLRLDPGTTLAESSRIGALAERALRGVPEVVHVGRRSGRAELDEHAEGVHVSELDVKLRRSDRPLAAVHADLRARIADLPGAKGIGQPIGHRIDHMLSGVRSQIAVKVFGDDLDTLRGQAEALRARLAAIPGIADLEVEKQVLTPQIQVRVDYDRALGWGIAPARLLRELQMLVDGERVTQVVEGARRFWLVLRLPEGARGIEGLRGLMVDTPGGRVPLAQLATVEEADGPNQVSRDDGRRRIVVSANAQGRALSDVVADIRAAVADTALPPGYFVTLGGQFQAQEEASRRIGLLSLGSAALVFLILFSRYRSGVLAAIVMANIPLSLVGAVAGLWLSGQPLSVAALVGFITLAGIAVRNGILKVSHYANLCAREGEAFGLPMLLRGSGERLTPVLMTALVAALALAPLLFESGRPGTEILYPVAVVIFSGLVSSTLLDAFLTPAMVALWGRRPVEALAAAPRDDAF
jgi:HME family heavy-metal exporter